MVEDHGGWRQETWELRGRAHRERGPAVLSITDDNHLMEEKWYKSGLLHRDNSLPAVIEYETDENGESMPLVEEYFVEGEYCRSDGGPTSILRDTKTGYILAEYFYSSVSVSGTPILNSIEDRPAYVEWRADGTLSAQEWYRQGRYHREGGKPSVVKFAEDGKSVISVEYWQNGRQNPVNANTPSLT